MSSQEQRRMLWGYVKSRVEWLQKGYVASPRKSGSVQALAQLRRAVGKTAGTTPETWTIEFEGLDPLLLGRGDYPSHAEQAIHAALTLYAVHQQSKIEPMHMTSDGWRDWRYHLGSAVRKLVNKDETLSKSLEDGEPPRRFAALVTASSFAETSHYARQIVQQLRAKSIPLDYAQLACDLADLQDPYVSDSVRMRWGRQYASGVPQPDAQHQELE